MSDTPPPNFVWTPTRKIRYIMREGEKILQQLWKTQQAPDLYDPRFPDNYEFRDIPLEMEEAAQRGIAPGENWIPTRFLRFVNRAGELILQQLWKIKFTEPALLQWNDIEVVDENIQT